MQPEQKIVRDWMQRTMARLGWSGAEWARRAKVDPSTVNRAVDDTYTSVTSLPVLDRLARAAGITSPLQCIESDDLVPVPHEDDIRAIVRGAMSAIPPDATRDESVSVISGALIRGLAMVRSKPELRSNQQALEAIGYALSTRQ